MSILTLMRGQPVTVIDTYSRRGKRIAVVVDRDGEQFEVFMEQLSVL